MSDDTNLLSRRQILGLFGGATGAAIVGASSGQTGTQSDGNLYGGISGMADAYQVGPKLYKGPLSALSEVPEKDGNDYIETDAGPNGNKYRFHHYNNGSWETQGWDLPSVSTDDSVTTRQDRIDFSEYNPHVDRSPELDATWAIKPSPTASNPLMDGSQITHRSAVAVADPFVRWVPSDGQYHVMVESTDSNGLGDITHYTSPDLDTFNYDGEVYNNGGNHVSWPFFFQWDGAWYMVPGVSGEFRILEKGSSWTDWSQVESTSISGIGDIAPFYWAPDDFEGGRWYFISRDSGTGTRLYHADGTGPQFTGRSWSEHPDSPILTESSDDVEGPAGRPIVTQGSIVDFTVQTETNPLGIRAFRLSSFGITSGSLTLNELGSSPLLRPQGDGWDGANVHHCEIVTGGTLSQPAALIDGSGVGDWRVGRYDVGAETPTKTVLQMSTESVGSAWDQINNLTAMRDLKGQWERTTADQYTVPEDGDYEVRLDWRYASSDSTVRFLGMVRNETTGNDNVVFSQNGAAGGAYSTFSESKILEDLSKGDELGIYGGQGTGSAVDLNQNSKVVIDKL